MTIRALIVDDERLARVSLRSMLAAHHDVMVVAEAATIAAAIASHSEQAPDVVFLDIQLRGETGFDLLAHLADPVVVFVTAFDQHAIRAFEVNALDYLLKPIDAQRLSQTLARVRAAVAARTVAPVESTREPPLRPLTIDDRLFLDIDRRPQFVAVRDVLAVLADDDYTTLLLRDGRRPLVSTRMSTWEHRLPPQVFARIHRSVLVQVDMVTAIEPWSHGTYRVRIQGLSAPLPMSRRMARALRERLG